MTDSQEHEGVRVLGRLAPQGTPPPEHESLHPDGLPVPRRYWSIAAIVLAIVMSVLDSTIVNVALPTLSPPPYATLRASPISAVQPEIHPIRED